MERGIIQCIDIHVTCNWHIEIVDRMRPIHNDPGGKGGAGSHNIEFRYNHCPPGVKKH